MVQAGAQTRTAEELAQRERARELGAGLVLAVYRLVKTAQLHALDNMAVLQQLEQTLDTIRLFSDRTGARLSILFAKGTVFIAGQLMKGSRGDYESALELGKLLEHFGLSEMILDPEVTSDDLVQFLRVLTSASRDATARKELARPSPRIRLRRVSPAVLGVDEQELSEEERIVRNYASAIVVMRRVFENLASHRYQLPNEAKRIAQKLVMLSEGDTPAFLGVTAMRNANHDAAGRSVNTSILAVAMARQLTSDLGVLAKIAMAALMYDVGGPYVLNLPPAEDGRPFLVPRMTEEEASRMPAATALVLTAMGRLHEASRIRSVIAYEAQWHSRRGVLGQLYGGARNPSVASRIVATSHRFNELLTPDPGASRFATPDEAIDTLNREASEDVDRAIVALLVGAVGMFPTGSLVELTTGERGVVVSTPSHPADYARPVVRLVYGPSGEPTKPTDVDCVADDQREVKQVLREADDRLRLVRDQVLAERGGGPTTVRPGRTTPQTQQRPPSSRRRPPVPSSRTRPRMPSRSAAPKILDREPTPAPTPSPLLLQEVLPRAEPLPTRPPSPKPPAVHEAVDDATPTPTTPWTPLPEDGTPTPTTPRTPPAAGLDDATPTPTTPRTPPPSEPAQPAGPEEPTLTGAALAERAAAEDTASSPPSAPQPRVPAPHAPEPQPSSAPPRVLTPDGPQPQPSSASPRVFAPDAPQPQPSSASPRVLAPDAPPAVESQPAEAPPSRPAATPPPKLVPDDAKPTATGTLAKTPMPHLLVYALDRQLTGTLVFSEEDGTQHALYVESGAPRRSWTSSDVAPLAALLVALGHLEQSEVTDGALAEVANDDALLEGEVLGSGRIEADDLVAALDEQMLQRVVHLFLVPATTAFEFYADTDLLLGRTSASDATIPALSLLMSGVRRIATSPLVESVLERAKGRLLGVREDADFAAFEFTPTETNVVGAILGSNPPFLALLDAHPANAVRAVVYTLLLTRSLELGGG